MLERRRLGRTGAEVSVLGLGGNGLMRTQGLRAEAVRLIHRALDLGITYFDAARVYADCEAYLGEALRGRREQVFLASKSADRTREGARNDLETSLRTLGTSYLDLWEIHDVRTVQDVERIIAPDGALAAFEQARIDGKVRFLGITAHHDPVVLHRALGVFSFDTCMIPVNLAEPHYASFPAAILPYAAEADVGVIGMKALCGGLLADPALPMRYALSQPVSTLLVGCDDVAQLEQNVAVAEAFERLTEDEMRDLVESSRPHARRLMYYKKKREFVFSLN